MNPKITQIELNLSRSTIKRILNRLQQQEIVIRKAQIKMGIKEYIKLDRDKSTFKSHRGFSSEIEITFKHF